MKEGQFQELLKSIQGDEGEASFIKATLGELLNGEFEGIADKKFKVTIKELDSQTLAESMTLGEVALLTIDPRCYPNLKEILRHELLHVELGGLKDHEPRFKYEARKRGISIWNV